MITAAQHASRNCPIVNAGAGQGVSVKDILELVHEQMGVGNKPSFSSQPKEGDPNAYIADITKARTWDWEPKKTGAKAS